MNGVKSKRGGNAPRHWKVDAPPINEIGALATLTAPVLEWIFWHQNLYVLTFILHISFNNSCKITCFVNKHQLLIVEDNFVHSTFPHLKKCTKSTPSSALWHKRNSLKHHNPIKSIPPALYQSSPTSVIPVDKLTFDLFATPHHDPLIAFDVSPITVMPKNNYTVERVKPNGEAWWKIAYLLKPSGPIN